MKVNSFCVVFFIVFMNVNGLLAFPAPYIPSYDDRYEQDLRQAQKNKNYFKEPVDSLNYAQYHYIGAHAAEKYKRFFPQYALQDQPIPGLLATGVRGLMITVYDSYLSWSSIIREGVSLVCSHPAKETKVFRKNGKPLYQTLHYEMNRIFNFLKSHPQAVITILFDDHADPAKMSRDIKEIIMKNDYDPILKPSNWPLAQKKGEWPTLGWMRKNNKRLVMFTDINNQHTDFTWPIQDYFWKNMYGTMDPKIACSQELHEVVEPKEKNRGLVSFGCYGNMSVSPNTMRCLDYNSMKNLMEDCQKRKFAKGKLFNGYWANYIINTVRNLAKEGRKTAFDYANELNAIKKK